MAENQKDKPILQEGIPGPNDLPVRIFWSPRKARLRMKWLRTTQVTLQKAFFDGDIKRILKNDPESFLYLTSGDALFQYYKEINYTKPPKAFVFHVSHCGSTLTSQLFKCMPGTIALSEPIVINMALQMADHLEHEEAVNLLKNLIPVLGHGCQEEPKNSDYVVKLSSWNILHLDLIKEAFPNVPCLFLYRNPKEVMPSLVRVCTKREGLFKKVGSVLHHREQFGYPDRSTISYEAECAQLLEIFFQEFLKHKDRFDFVLEYPEIKNRLIPMIERILGQEVGAETRQRMEKTFSQNAKRKGTFQPDREQKLASLTPVMQTETEKTVWHSYVQIQNWRGIPISS